MPLRILIADDSASIRRVVRSYLENNSNWEICGEAEDGRATVERVRELMPDAVVLDFSMPIVNGLDAAQQMTAISPNIRIVMFTAHDSSMLRLWARNAGIRAVVAKDGKASLQALQRALTADEPLAA